MQLQTLVAIRRINLHPQLVKLMKTAPRKAITTRFIARKFRRINQNRFKTTAHGMQRSRRSTGARADDRNIIMLNHARSEERRVGKECRGRMEMNDSNRTSTIRTEGRSGAQKA